jgi:hypothetical protein
MYEVFLLLTQCLIIKLWSTLKKYTFFSWEISSIYVSGEDFVMDYFNIFMRRGERGDLHGTRATSLV